MGISFLFDVNSQHVYGAPQSVIFTSDLVNNPQYGFSADLIEKTTGPATALFGGALRGRWTIDPTAVGNVIGSIAGTSGEVVINNAFQTQEMTGVSGRITAQSTNNNSTVNGGKSEVDCANTSSVGSATGHLSIVRVMNGGAVMTTLRGNDSVLQFDVGSSIFAPVVENYRAAMNTSQPITTWYGMHVVSPVYSAGMQNAYGIYVENITASTFNEYAIYTSNQGFVRFGDQVEIHSGITLTRQPVNNSDYVVDKSSSVIAQTGVMSAPRIWSLPPANMCQPGHILICVDESGTVTGINSITITRNGADTINGLATVVLTTAYGGVKLICNGVSKWTIIP